MSPEAIESMEASKRTTGVCGRCGIGGLYAGQEECGNYIRACARRVRRNAQRLAKGRVLPFYVASYRIHRVYGGPEEGGWWYDATECIDVRKCWTWQEGRAAVREMTGENPQPRYSRCSVLGSYDVGVRTCANTDEIPETDEGGCRYE